LIGVVFSIRRWWLINDAMHRIVLLLSPLFLFFVPVFLEQPARVLCLALMRVATLRR
jgi:hypothetical protein